MVIVSLIGFAGRCGLELVVPLFWFLWYCVCGFAVVLLGLSVWVGLCAVCVFVARFAVCGVFVFWALFVGLADCPSLVVWLLGCRLPICCAFLRCV